MSSNISDILLILVIFQLLFLSFYLFTQDKGNPQSNRLLAFFFLCIALNLLDVVFALENAYSTNPWLMGWGSCLPLLFGPLIYFYTYSVLEKNFTITFKKLIHFLPFIILFIATEVYILTRSTSVQQKVLSDVLHHRIPPLVSIVSTLIFLQFLGYIVASLRLTSSYKRMASQQFSNSKQIDLSWLSSTILFFLFVIIGTIVNGLLAQTELATYFLVGLNITVLAMLIYIITVLLRALQRPYFFSLAEITFSKNLPIQQDEKTSRLAVLEKQRITQEVLLYMKTHKPYLEPELSLEQLAKKLSLKPRMLSQAINDILGQNFFDFINRHRIEEASLLLTNPKDEKITVLEILYEVGFNSKSSFNTLFKKYKGLTPTEFRKKQKA